MLVPLKNHFIMNTYPKHTNARRTLESGTILPVSVAVQRSQKKNHLSESSDAGNYIKSVEELLFDECNEEIFHSLDQPPVDIDSYILGLEEGFSRKYNEETLCDFYVPVFDVVNTREKNWNLLIDLQTKCLSSIKTELLRIGRPVWGEELNFARFADNLGVQTNIELIFVDSNMVVTIVDGEGHLSTLASKMEGSHIMATNALLICDQLYKIGGKGR
ncbi:MAG: hypothetical protein JWQ40_5058 [Segetibacter sp.]|jgi:hypothetical protein|nr:hypothetical protein [Segetibacter sp.]